MDQDIYGHGDVDIYPRHLNSTTDSWSDEQRLHKTRVPEEGSNVFIAWAFLVLAYFRIAEALEEFNESSIGTVLGAGRSRGSAAGFLCCANHGG
jgi:hypothetical protein